MATKKSDTRPVKGKKIPEKSAEIRPKFSVGQIKEFVSDVKVEFNKVAWPDKKHTMGSTVVVVILVMIISFYLGAVDLFLGKMVEYILR